MGKRERDPGEQEAFIPEAQVGTRLSPVRMREPANDYACMDAHRSQNGKRGQLSAQEGLEGGYID